MPPCAVPQPETTTGQKLLACLQSSVPSDKVRSTALAIFPQPKTNHFPTFTLAKLPCPTCDKSMNPPLGGVDTQLHSLSISPPLGVAFRREIFFARRSRGPKNQNRLNVHRHKNLTLLLSSTDTRPVLDNNNVKFSRCVFLVDYFF